MLNQFRSLSRVDQVSMLKALRAEYTEAKATDKAIRAQAKALKEQTKVQKAEERAAKQAAQIAKAKERLDKLLEKQSAKVGIAAAKANRRPSKAKITTFGAEDNAIAAAIVAKRATKGA